MTISVPFQPQFTWRKLGYLYYTNSLDYREVLNQNPGWKVTELPPIGAQIRLSPNSNTRGTPGTLTQGNTIFGFPSGDSRDALYPYPNQEAYSEALNRYTIKGVVQRQMLNGLMFDTTQAATGIQTPQ